MQYEKTINVKVEFDDKAARIQMQTLEGKIDDLNKKQSLFVQQPKAAAEVFQKLSKVMRESFSKAGALMEQAGTSIKNFGEFAKTSFSNLGKFASAASTNIKNLAGSFLDFFQMDQGQLSIISFVKFAEMPISTELRDFVQRFNEVGVESWNNNLGNVTFIGGIFSRDLGMALEGGKNKFKGIFNSIASIVGGVLNFIIDGFNGCLGGVDKVVSKVDDVIGIDLSIPKIPKVHIPRLATGTVIPPNREFLAVLGDNKRETEVVSPLSTIEQAVQNALNKGGGPAGEITVKVPVSIDGREIFEIVKKLEHEQFHRTGKPAFSY